MFPGDPPEADLGLLFAILLLLVGLLLLWASRFWRAAERGCALRALNGVAISLVAVATLGVTVAAARIAMRHTGEWKVLRDALRSESEQIESKFGGRMLSQEEYMKLKTEIDLKNIQFEVGEPKGLVRVRLHGRVSPYVGLDFGAGQNAYFELRTMYCTYSD